MKERDPAVPARRVIDMLKANFLPDGHMH